MDPAVDAESARIEDACVGLDGYQRIAYCKTLAKNTFHLIEETAHTDSVIILAAWRYVKGLETKGSFSVINLIKHKTK